MIIAIEGSDQAGKKTQTAMLAKALKSQKIKTDYGLPSPNVERNRLVDKTKILNIKRKIKLKPTCWWAPVGAAG